ncbi:MAG TPA: DUF1592 domain-containing protein [Polyangiaceae bacterium]|nr:DUF1592 domain-containing protein [Polyangiaceae bacterium]
MRRIVSLAALAVAAVACDSTLNNGPSSGDGVTLPPLTGAGSPSEQAPSGGGDEANTLPGVALDGTPVRSRLVRLTHTQWEHSVRDVLGLDADPGLAVSFTGDPPNGSFTNNERALTVTPNLRLDYQRAAEELSARVARDPAALAKIFPGADGGEFIASLGRRVYRRDLDADEQARYRALFDSGASVFENGDARADGAQLVLEAMLQSPHFLYRTELGDDGAALSGFEIAAKLSFLLRNTTPNDELLDAAASGALDSPAGVVELARQLLDGPDAAEALQRFHGELFGLDRYLSIAKDPEKFPEHHESLNPALARAEELFLDHLFREGLGLEALLTSTLAYANAELAPFYGVDVSGEELREVDLGPERPGLFTRLGFLAYNGTLRDPDSIHRGVEINRTMMCASLSPPPGIIPALPVVQPGQTNRERVNAHTGPGTCGAGCHATIINPIGFAFENFDAMGQLRDADNGKPIDTSSEYDFGDGLVPFDGAAELMPMLAASPRAHACYARHLAEFSLGRDIDDQDRTLIDGLQRASVLEGESIKEMFMAVVASPAFGQRSPIGGAL